VFTVDVDQLPELAQMFKVMSVPTILVMRSGAVVGRLVGARSASRLSEEVAALL
jgi:thioredoxin 1